jgi:hypothetical protein
MMGVGVVMLASRFGLLPFHPLTDNGRSDAESERYAQMVSLSTRPAVIAKDIGWTKVGRPRRLPREAADQHAVRSAWLVDRQQMRAGGRPAEGRLKMSRLTVHDPRGYPPKVIGKRLAARPQSLVGKTLYLVDCLFDNSEAFMDQLKRWFTEHLPGVDTRMIKPRESWVDDPVMRQKIAADGHAAVLGVGL